MAKKKATKRAPARAKKAGAKKVLAIQKVSAIPKGYRTVTPYLTVNDGAGALAFYGRAFGARELMRMPAPDGKLGHAEFRDRRLHHHAERRVPGHEHAEGPDLAGRHHRLAHAVCAERRRRLPAGGRRGLQVAHAAHRHVLGRSLRQARGPLRQPVGPGHAQGGRAAQADGRAGQGRDGADERRAEPDARHPRFGDHRHHQEALHGGQLESRPRDAARLRPRADHRALGRRQAGAPDPQAERGDGADQARRLLPGHRRGGLLRRARPGRPRHGRRALRRDQRGRAPGLQGRLPARVDGEVAVRPCEHRRQHAGGDPRGRRAGRRAEARHHGQGRRLREPLEVHDAHAGRRASRA